MIHFRFAVILRYITSRLESRVTDGEKDSFQWRFYTWYLLQYTAPEHPGQCAKETSRQSYTVRSWKRRSLYLTRIRIVFWRSVSWNRVKKTCFLLTGGVAWFFPDRKGSNSRKVKCIRGREIIRYRNTSHYAGEDEPMTNHCVSYFFSKAILHTIGLDAYSQESNARRLRFECLILKDNTCHLPDLNYAKRRRISY